MEQHTNPTFTLYGTAPHLQISSTEDLRHALNLDEAHWVAVSAPIETLVFDEVFLRLLDSDGDVRITCHDVKKAITWLLNVFTDHSGIDQGRKILDLSALNTIHPDGERLRASGAKVLRRFGQKRDHVSLDEVRKIKAEAEALPVSEWGVVLPEAAGGDALQVFIGDILATVGGTLHPSGKTGIDEAKLSEFIAQAASYVDWLAMGCLGEGGAATDIMPLGADTGRAYEALKAVRVKIDQFFAQCEAASLDERLIVRMGWQEAELANLDFDDPKVIEDVLAKAPLAKANAARELDLAGPVNPFYAQALQVFATETMRPVLQAESQVLTALQWRAVKEFFAAHQAWDEGRGGERVAGLGPEKLRDYLNSEYPEQVRKLMAKSSRAAVMLDGIRLVEKAILFQSAMITFANNFISFPHLYDTNKRALFEMGTLVIDGRRFNMAVIVKDRASHMKVAETSGMYVLYVELTDEPAVEKMEVSVPVTSGSCGNLCVGKRGVFYTLDGREKNARVMAIIDNPISFSEALSAPVKKMGRVLTGKIESWSSGADKKLEAQTAEALGSMASAGKTPQPAGGGLSVAGGMMMGGGVALAALGSAAAYITKTLSEINPWAILFGILGALALVFLPLSLVAYLKLRRRDLSAILEGAGWGINARMRLTRSQGLYFTQRPKYPENARGIPSFLLRRILIAILVFLMFLGLVQLGRWQARLSAGKGQAGKPPVVKQAT